MSETKKNEIADEVAKSGSNALTDKQHDQLIVELAKETMKKVLALALAAAMALSMVACGSSEPAAPAEPEKQRQSPAAPAPSAARRCSAGNPVCPL